MKEVEIFFPFKGLKEIGQQEIMDRFIYPERSF